MNTPIHTQITASKLPLLLPRTMCVSERVYSCSGSHVEACLHSNLSRNYIASSKQPLNKNVLPLRALATSRAQDVSAKPLTGSENVVLLLNLGGPETLEDVQPILFNLFADPDIVRLPRLFRFFQKPLAQFISVSRAPESKEGYASIGGGSPLRRITDAQAEELRKALWEKMLPGGRLKIIDRKKNIFKLAQGEYIAPEKIENVYAKCKFVAQCFIYGDSLNSSLVAIVSVDPDVLRPWALSEGIKCDDVRQLCNDPRVRAAVLADMDAIGREAQLRGFEFAKAVTLVAEPFSMENGLLTPTMKVKRPQAKEYFAEAIAKMYAELSTSDPSPNSLL